MPTRDFTLSNSGTQGLKKLTDIDGTEVSIQLRGVIVGSQCYIEDEDSNILMNETATDTTVTASYTHTEDKNLTIRVRKASSVPKYRPYSAAGTVTSDGFIGYVEQVLDDVIG
jgi:hypothetical protein